MIRAELREALEDANVRAFLRALRLGEGTADDDGYRRIVGGQLFDHFLDHPRVRVWIPRYKVWSTAAGAYQITARTWDGLVKQYRFDDFTPHTQDEAAVALIVEKRALNHVKAGRIELAVARVGSLWASLPSSQAGQRKETMAAVIREFCQNGGTLCAST